MVASLFQHGHIPVYKIGAFELLLPIFIDLIGILHQ